MSKYIDRIAKDPTVDREHFLKARFLWHYRFATPFVILVFTCFGLVLGVTDPRSRKSRAYMGGIGGIIFGYVVVMMFKWFAEKGAIPAPIAAWLPITLMSAFGFWLVYQKNRLPPSESPLDPAHIQSIVYLRKKWANRRTKSA